MKKRMIMVLTVTMTVGTILGMSGCGGTKLVGTYTCDLEPADVAGNSQHAAFLADGVPSQTNTLVLNEDTYSLEKKIDEDSIHIDIVFTGSYSADSNTVTLAVPDDVEWNVDWGDFIEMEYFPGVLTGKLSDGDKSIECKRIVQADNSLDGGHDPLNMFLTPYYVDSEKTGEVVLNVDKDSMTFTYAEESSSEDE